MPLQALSNAEFMALKFPTPRCVVKPIIAWGSFVMLNGDAESGKTMLANTLAMAVAGGELFLEQYECEQGPVVFIQLDMPLREFQARWKRLDHLRLPIHFALNDSPIDITKQLPPLQRFAELKPALVVIDSLRSIHLLDEDSSLSPAVVRTHLRGYFPDAAIMWLHHDRKSFPGEGEGTHHRGSSAWRDCCAAQLELRRINKNKGKIWLTELRFGKIQNAPEQKSIKLTLDTKTLLLKPVGLTALQWQNKCKRDHPMYSESQIAVYVDAKLEEDQ